MTTINHTSSISKIRKRNGQIVEFDQKKISEAIWKAAKSVGGKNRDLAEKISSQITAVLEVFFKSKEDIPTVEQIQDLAEKILIENGHAKTAKAFILFRQKQKEIRQRKETRTMRSMQILEQYVLLKDKSGQLIETPEEMFRRVAKNISLADLAYKDFDQKKSEEEFYKLISEMNFLPNLPTLMHAGTNKQQLASCFVLPVENSVALIFDTLKADALIQQDSGDAGFNFSAIAARSGTTGQEETNGPVAYIKVFDTAANAIKRTGKRKEANMAVLDITHPDILDFINAKDKENSLANFNISVGITDTFMKAVENDQMYDLIDPISGIAVNSLNAKSVFDLICIKAWQNGVPGLLFLDEINRSNPLKQLGKISATNSSGEQPLLPYEACHLGSINLAKHLDETGIDWEKLSDTTAKAVHFLDNCIDMNNYKIEKIKELVLQNRKIGLGVMGFAEILYRLEIPYNSQAAEELAAEIMQFINKHAIKTTEKLAKTRGEFPNFGISIHAEQKMPKRRNATLTSIGPAETLSMIAETSAGIEPVSALASRKNMLDGSELTHINPYFAEKISSLNIGNEEMIKNMISDGSLRRIDGLPETLKKTFVVTGDITPAWHIRIQAAFQKFTDNGVSKTVNLPSHADVEDFKNCFTLAYKMQCKGITAYRDRIRKKQVSTHIGKNEIQNMTPEDKFIDNQTALPFNSESYDNFNNFKNVQEVIPPPIIQQQ